MSFRSKFNKQYAACTVYLSSRHETLDWMLDPRSISIALVNRLWIGYALQKNRPVPAFFSQGFYEPL